MTLRRWLEPDVEPYCEHHEQCADADVRTQAGVLPVTNYGRRSIGIGDFSRVVSRRKLLLKGSSKLAGSPLRAPIHRGFSTILSRASLSGPDSTLVPLIVAIIRLSASDHLVSSMRSCASALMICFKAVPEPAFSPIPATKIPACIFSLLEPTVMSIPERRGAGPNPLVPVGSSAGWIAR